MRRKILKLCVSAIGLFACACNPVEPVVKFIARAEEQGDKTQGITFYVGGAGPVGNVGSWDIPQGLVDAGYHGYVEVFPWQGMTHAGDQINLSRNRSKGAELSYEIRDYRRIYQDQKINIIALSAGTGIATFALEFLPDSMKVDNVVFLGCSMSSEYDLSRALQRINGGLYVIYSQNDPILKNVVTYTGTVDRSSAAEGIAGIEGFHVPKSPRREAEAQYRKLHNVEYRYEFEETGYKGGHTDSTSRLFISQYIAPIFLGKPETLVSGPTKSRSGRPRIDISDSPHGP